MDFINTSFDQLRELFRSMTPGGRITAALLLVVVAVSVAYLFNAKVEGPDELLLGGQGFTTEEISAMQVAFGKAGLSNFEVNGSQIRIPKAQQAAYLAALADSHALPHSFGDYLTRALENSSMLGTSSDKKQAARVAMFKELRAIIRELSYVTNASVIYDPRARSGFNRQPKSKATATVTPRGLQQLDSQQVLAIRSIVAGGFGLQPNDVIVVETTSGRTHNASNEGDIAAGADDVFLKTKAAHEQRFEDKITNALAYIPGVFVTVDVDLDRTLKSVSQQIVIDPETTVTLHSRSDKRSNTSSPGRGGRVGFAAQSGANSAQSLGGGAAGPESVQKDELKEDTRTASHEEIHTETAGLTPKSVTVAVSVPRTYVEQVFHGQQEPVAEGEEPTKPTEQQLLDIEGVVRKDLLAQIPNMIPHFDGGTTGDVVSVAFIKQGRLPDVEGPPITETATSWLAMNWSTLGMFGFAGFGLIMLRSMLKSTPPVAPLATGAATIAAADNTPDDEATEPAPHERQLRRNIPSGPNLAEELAEIVKEDSEAAANVLRGWITSGT